MWIRRIIPVSLGLTFLLSGIVTLTSAQTSSVTTLTIGVIGSSSASALDRQLYQAAVLAADNLNADSDRLIGPDNQRYMLEIKYYEADTVDDVTDALNDAVGDDVIAVIGPQDTELSDKLVDAGTPDVAVILGAPDAATTTSIFRVAATYATQTQAAADYLVNERHFQKIAVEAVNTEVAQHAADTFRDVIDSELIVANLTHAADKTNFSSDARTIRDARADALFVYTLDAQMVNLLKALNEVGWNGTIIYSGLDADFLTLAGADLTQNLLGLTQWSAGAYDADSQQFVADYVALYGQNPPDAAAAYYDAVQLIGAAVEEVGDSASEIAGNLNSDSEFDGVQGVYDKTATNAVMLVQSQSDGRLLEVVRYDAITCENCPDVWWADTTDESIDTTDTFKIGLLTTPDGPSEATGENIEQAARMAVREINDAGGVIGSDNVRYTLVLTTYSATTADDASTAFDQAVNDGMELILGPDFNAQILNDLYAAENATIPQLVSATNSQITADEPANYVFQLRSNDTTLVNAVADYLLNVRELTRFASVAVRTEYGLNAIDNFDEAMINSDDGQLVLRLEHDVDAVEVDLAGLALQIANANVEAVVVWSTQPAAASLLNELVKLNWRGTVIYGYLTPEFAASLTLPDSIELISPVNWWSTAGDWVSRDFTTRYTARYGEAPEPQSASYYDGIYLIAHAITETGTDASQLQSWLIDLDKFKGVQGTYAPSDYASGELTRSVEIVKVVGQQFIEIARYDGTTCRAYCGD